MAIVFTTTALLFRNELDMATSGGISDDLVMSSLLSLRRD